VWPVASDPDQLRPLERLSAQHPNWLLRCRGHLFTGEAFELIIFRGFSSSISHHTTADADTCLLQTKDQLETIEILRAPLQSGAEHVIQPALAPEDFWQWLNQANRC